MSALETETLYYGDCLDWMSQWDDRSVDLIYLDPPFNSNQDYNILYTSESGHDAQYRAFGDTWTWDDKAADRFASYDGAPGRRAHDAVVGLYRILGPSGMLAYLTYMAERLEQMHRLLRPTGSIYLHCDPTASHYLKIVMDAIFGARNFRSEIVWRRSNAHSKTSTQFGPIHDTILFFSKTDTFTFHPGSRPYTKAYIESRFKNYDEHGRYQTNYLTGPGIRSGESGKSWRGFDPTTANRHWAIPRSLRRFLPDDGAGMSSHEKLESLHGQGWIVFPKKGGGQPMYKQYLGDGVPYQDIWSYQPNTKGVLYASSEHIDQDVKWLEREPERLGYPTQKPKGLLERILETSTKNGDVVLDPFCGCGTTIDAARALDRRWIGIDISSFAIDLIREKRLGDKAIPTKGIPTDLASARKLATEKPFDFESWAVMRLPGFAPNTKQVGDGGIDGRAKLANKPDNFDSRLALAQVKGGKFSLSTLRDFIHVTRRDKAALGCYVTLDPVSTPASKAEVAGFGKISVAGYPYPRMQIWPVAHYFDQRLPSMPIMNDPYSGKPMTQGLLF